MWQAKRRINDRLDQLNIDLKTICAALEFTSPEEITFYSARHTWATVQKRSGKSTEVIQEGLGHKNKVITEMYLAQFDIEVLDEADELILATGQQTKVQNPLEIRFNYFLVQK